MEVEKELSQLAPDKDTVLTIGVFDGVHLGHKHLVAEVLKQARPRDLLGGAITFREHPEEVLSSKNWLPRLTAIDDKIALLKQEGLDFVIALSFTPEVARLSARQFINLLKKHLRMRGLVIGPDFALGRDREGSADNLRKLGQEMGFTVTAMPPLVVEGEVVSSTAIRQALAKGDMERVVRLIGRGFTVRGQVTTGDRRGSNLGFPTANLEPDVKLALPADGVYATRSHIDGKTYRSVTNIGRRPTFGVNKRNIETFVLDYSGDLYGLDLAIEIVARLRGEKKFDSVEELKQQIAEDIKQAGAILDARGEG